MRFGPIKAVQAGWSWLATTTAYTRMEERKGRGLADISKSPRRLAFMHSIIYFHKPNSFPPLTRKIFDLSRCRKVERAPAGHSGIEMPPK